jgi:hypothetical protein
MGMMNVDSSRRHSETQRCALMLTARASIRHRPLRNQRAGDRIGPSDREGFTTAPTLHGCETAASPRSAGVHTLPSRSVCRMHPFVIILSGELASGGEAGRRIAFMAPQDVEHLCPIGHPRRFDVRRVECREVEVRTHQSDCAHAGRACRRRRALMCPARRVEATEHGGPDAQVAVAFERAPAEIGLQHVGQQGFGRHAREGAVMARCNDPIHERLHDVGTLSGGGRLMEIALRQQVRKQRQTSRRLPPARAPHQRLYLSQWMPHRR